MDTLLIVTSASVVLNAACVGLLLEARSSREKAARLADARFVTTRLKKESDFSIDRLMEALGAILPVVTSVIDAVQGRIPEPVAGQPVETGRPAPIKEPENCPENKVWSPELERCQWVSEEAWQASEEHGLWVAAVEADGKTILKDQNGHEIVLNADGTGCRPCDKAALTAYKASVSSGKSPAVSGKATAPEKKVVETSGSVVGLSSEKKA